MLHQTLTIIELKMPSNFPIVPYETIYNRVLLSKGKSIDDFKREQFNGSWLAISHRFRTSWEHCEEFTRITKQFGTTPLAYENQYVQERELFGFFVSSLSTIESFCYGLYFIGSIIDPDIFNFVPNRLDKITCKASVNALEQLYPPSNLPPSGSIIDELIKVIGFQPPKKSWPQQAPSPQFAELDEIRNILAHRIVPIRNICIEYIESLHDGTSIHRREDKWINGIPIDNETTVSRQIWLAETLEVCLHATDAFTANRL